MTQEALNLNEHRKYWQSNALANHLVAQANKIYNEAGSIDDAAPALIQLIESQNLAVPRCKPVGLLLRTQDVKFWERQLALRAAREAEHRQIKSGRVQRPKAGNKATPYASNTTVSAYQERQLAYRMSARERYLVDEESGSALRLSDVLEGAGSPKCRVAELLTRTYGCQTAGDSAGHEASFVTITCPSRFHAVSPIYDQALTPACAQDYLRKLWARARAALKREGLTPYGVRVAEPHHDATPHWHLLLWAPKHEMPRILEILKQYSLADSPNEKGANRRRFTVKKIDREKGSAVGYVLKYICKNIVPELPNGEDLGDITDQGNVVGPAVDTVSRIQSWASLWAIRQFQFIGTPPIGPWRELRRLRDPLLDMPALEAMRQAADDGDWHTYACLYRSHKPQIIRRSEALEALRNNDEQAALEALNKYGEPIFRVIGLRCGIDSVTTRSTRWTLLTLDELAAKIAHATGATLSFLQHALERCLLIKDSEITSAPKARLGSLGITVLPPADSEGIARHTPHFQNSLIAAT